MGDGGGSGRRYAVGECGEILTSWKIMSQMSVTWSKGAVPPRFGYLVEGQSNAVGRPLGEPVGRPRGAAVGRLLDFFGWEKLDEVDRIRKAFASVL